MIYKLPEATDVISYGYLDRNSNIWLCSNDSILLYNTETAQTLQFPNVLDENITVVEQAMILISLWQQKWGSGILS